MNHMFSYCHSFNQPLDNWNVSNVTNMNRMFFGCPYITLFKFKFNTNEPHQILKTDKKEKCCICYDYYDIFYALCDRKYNNDHFYCEECLDIFQQKKCCICKTRCILTKFIYHI